MGSIILIMVLLMMYVIGIQTIDSEVDLFTSPWRRFETQIKIGLYGLFTLLMSVVIYLGVS